MVRNARPQSKITQPNFVGVLRLLPDVSTPMLHSTHALMRGKSSLTAGEREFIYQYCSRANRCEYAATGHSSCAVALGIPKKFFRSPPAKLAALLKFARKLTLKPASISRRDKTALVAAGWDEQAIVEVIYICALVGWTNRLLFGFTVPANKRNLLQSGRRIAREGYLPAA
jgi:alkylhydroperoxidase family enzyme